MENYIKNYKNYNRVFVYDFVLGDGGIGDYLKFFMIILTECIENNVRIYNKINNLEIENEQLKSNEIVVMNNKEKSTKEPLFKCCNLCYDKIEDNEIQYSFRCENKKCNKLFHTKCILKINEEKRNQCCYCKVSYKNYNFIPTQFFLYEERQDLDYLVYDKDNFDYSQPYFYWIANFYKIDKQKLNKITKIQSYYRGRLTRKKLQCKNIQAEIQKKYSYYIQNSISNYNFVENDI